MVLEAFSGRCSTPEAILNHETQNNQNANETLAGRTAFDFESKPQNKAKQTRTSEIGFQKRGEKRFQNAPKS